MISTAMEGVKCIFAFDAAESNVACAVFFL